MGNTGNTGNMGMHVIVVGGGIGGLCLAQGLRKAGVSVAVYEKGDSRSQSSWLQGFQIHVNAAGSRALEECLLPAARASFAANALQPSAGVQMLTEHLKQLTFLEPTALSGSNPIVRSAFRRVLLEGVDDIVHFGKQFVGVERTADGKLQVTFGDGSATVGDVLVAADGIGSRVRALYLPHAKVVDTGLVGIAGKLPIGDQTRSYLPEHLLTRLTSILAPKGMYMVVTQSIHKQDRQPDASARAEIAPLSDESDHAIWVLLTARKRFGNDPKALFDDGPALQELASRLMRTWHPVLRRMVAETDPTVIAATPLQTSVPIAPWETTTVTLLGDAIHAMTPLQGLGGSTALRDAALLCSKLVEVNHGTAALIPALHDYEAAMIAYGFDAVQTSLRVTRMVSNPSRLSRALFRTVMRLSRILPPLRGRLFRRQMGRGPSVPQRSTRQGLGSRDETSRRARNPRGS
jgi:2-polyprenyl-6-methoxyphenol hydroxylase-like FAD-dependent oxidoreductase